MTDYKQIDVDQLTEFLKFVDRRTYMLDDTRYYASDNEPVTEEELAHIFLQGDADPKP